MKININENIVKIITKINHIGNRAYVCQNTLREILMNETPSFYTLLTDANIKKIKTIFNKVLENREIKNCVTIIDNQMVIRVYYKSDDAPKDNQEFFKGVLKKSDFTINSLAYSPDGEMLDFFGGMSDLENKVIKFVECDNLNLSEKPARMIRAIRYLAQFGYKIEDDTIQMIKKCSMLIKRAQSEKVREELDKILMSPNPETISLLHEYGLMQYILPEVDACFSVPQRNKYHIYNVGEHITYAVKESANDTVVRWSALLHDIGKPSSKSVDSNGIIHFYGHHKQSVLLATDILRRLKFDNKTAEDILVLIENHDVRIEPVMLSVKKMMARTGKDLFAKLLLLQEADNKAKNVKYLNEKLNKINEVRKIYQKIMLERQPFRVSDLAVTGRDLNKIGFKPGHEVADTLMILLEEVLINPAYNTKDYLLKRAKEIRIKKISKKDKYNRPRQL